jgi:hypothetical protein
MGKKDPKSGKKCPPHSIYVKRTTKGTENGKPVTYTFYGCHNCGYSSMDISRGR